MSTIVIASGGTGGHLYPTIAVAEAIRAVHPELRIVFVGTHDRIESREVPKLGFEFFPIRIQAPGRSPVQLLKFPTMLYGAYRRSKAILKEVGASAFLGGGAYLSVPVALAAKNAGIPVSLLEINAVVGRANRTLATKADKIFVSYPEAINQFPQAIRSSIQTIGTPVRDGILHRMDAQSARTKFNIDPDRTTLLVFGGSLGARSINAAMAKSIKTFIEAGVNVIWQTGSSAKVNDLRQEFEIPGRVWIREFISEMPAAYAAADLVVSRAGASTLAELSTLGKTAILVPYPLAAMDHQTKNAEAYSSRGAARVITDEQLPLNFEASVLELLNNEELRMSYAKKMLASENITAGNVVAEYLIGQAMRTKK